MKFSESSDSITGATVYIERQVYSKEQTEEDGSYTRFEAGRSLNGVYYSAEGKAINFTVTLESAMHSLAATIGLTLATCVSLLTF